MINIIFVISLPPLWPHDKIVSPPPPLAFLLSLSLEINLLKNINNVKILYFIRWLNIGKVLS